MSDKHLVLALVGAFLILLFVFIAMWVRVPHNKAGVVTGLRQRIIAGNCGLIVPFLERVDYIPLKYRFVDIPVTAVSSTGKHVNVNIKVRVSVSTDNDMILKVAKRFLSNKSKQNTMAVIEEAVTMTIISRARELISKMSDEKLTYSILTIKEDLQNSSKDDFYDMGLEVVVLDSFIEEKKVSLDKASNIEITHLNGRTLLSVPNEFLYNMTSDSDILIKGTN